MKHDTDSLAAFKVDKYDREYEGWKREPLNKKYDNTHFFIALYHGSKFG